HASHRGRADHLLTASARNRAKSNQFCCKSSPLLGLPPRHFQGNDRWRRARRATIMARSAGEFQENGGCFERLLTIALLATFSVPTAAPSRKDVNRISERILLR